MAEEASEKVQSPDAPVLTTVSKAPAAAAPTTTATSSAAAAVSDPDAVENVRALMDSRLRMTLTDNRVMVGTFTCFDKQGNVLLNETVEQNFAKGDNLNDMTLEPELVRHVGLVLVPRRWIVSVYAVPDEYS